MLPEDKHAVILLHGLCGASPELSIIPKMLKRIGFEVVEPVIPGYSAAAVERNSATTWESWCDHVESEITRLRQNFRTVSLCGLSMGATLALAVAARSHEVLSVVALSPILKYDGWSTPWYHFGIRLVYALGFRDWLYKESDPFGIKNLDMRRRVAKALQKEGVAEVGAAAIPARQIDAAQSLMRHVSKTLPSVKANLLVIHSIDDETVSPKSAECIIRCVQSEVRKVIWLGDCYHIITVDNEREIVVNETVQFIFKMAETHNDDLNYHDILQLAPLRDRR